MCVVSMVYDFAKTIPAPYWNRPSLSEFQKLIEKVEVVDAQTGQPNCVDPAKTAFMADIEKRVAKLEKAAAKAKRKRKKSAKKLGQVSLAESTDA